MFNIYIENSSDADAVYSLVQQAFDRSEEANLVKALREKGVISLSLVALNNEQIATIGCFIE